MAVNKKAAEEAAVLKKIAAYPERYRNIGERIHAVILASVPELRPKLYYGQPGYTKGGPVLVFFRLDDDKDFSLGLTEKANRAVEEGATDRLMASGWFLDSIDDREAHRRDRARRRRLRRHRRRGRNLPG